MTHNPHDDIQLRTSDLLMHVLDKDHHETITIQNFLYSLGSRVYGLGMLLWVLPNCIPMIPGVAGITGIMIIVMALQMAFGRPVPWLPKVIQNRPLPRSKLLQICKKALPKLRRLETLIRPRYPFLTNSAMKVFVAIVIILMAFILLLPIPIIGNMPPAWGIALLSMSLIEKDGLMMVAGMGVSSLAAYLLFVASETAIHVLFF